MSVWSKVQMICIWSSWCHCHPIISCFIKIHISLTFLVVAYTGCPRKEAVKRVSVCSQHPKSSTKVDNSLSINIGRDHWVVFLICVSAVSFHQCLALDWVIGKSSDLWKPAPTVPQRFCFGDLALQKKKASLRKTECEFAFTILFLLLLVTVFWMMSVRGAVYSFSFRLLLMSKNVLMHVNYVKVRIES